MIFASGRLVAISKSIAVFVFAFASTFPMWAQSSTRPDWQSQQNSDVLQHAYLRAFRFQNNMDRLPAVREYGVITWLTPKDLPQFRSQLTKEQFRQFRNSAWRFDQVDQSVRSHIHMVAEADRAAHPGTRVLSEDARMKIDGLVSERLRAVRLEIEALHRGLDDAVARQFDENALRYEAETPVRTSLRTHRWTELQNGVLGTTHDAKALDIAEPRSTDPGGGSCQFIPTDELPGDELACEDEGGDWDTETCECFSGDGDGGGAPPDLTPIITSVTPNVWNAGSTVSPVTINGNAFGTNRPTLAFSDPSLSHSLSSYNSSQIVAAVTIPPNTPNEDVTLTVTSTGSGGSGFFSGGGETSPTSAPSPIVSVSQRCPSSISISGTATEPLAPKVPTFLTGIGIVAKMQVNPSTTDWDDTQIIESLVTTSNSCPSGWGNPCGQTSAFTVGEGGTAVNGQVFPPVHNQFLDEHATVDTINDLAASGLNACSSVCTQHYSCNGTVIGTFTITKSYAKGTVGNYTVTNVTATKH